MFFAAHLWGSQSRGSKSSARRSEETSGPEKPRLSSAHSCANETVDGGAARPGRLMGGFNKRTKTEVKNVERLPPTKTNNRDYLTHTSLPPAAAPSGDARAQQPPSVECLTFTIWSSSSRESRASALPLSSLMLVGATVCERREY